MSESSTHDNSKPISSFDELLDRYEKPIYNIIFRMVGDREEAADLTQETFVAAYKSFQSFRGESNVFTWLCQIAVNKCKNKFKERDRKRRFEFLLRDLKFDVDEQVENDSASGVEDHTPLSELERKELQTQITEAISKLPEEYRMVIVLRDVQGLSYQEISRIVGISLEAVKVRIHRGRSILRQKLGPYLQD